MVANRPNVFVRTTPQKISITETYRYKAEISDYIYMSFTGADSEITVEFLYDGELRDFRWKLRVFWEGLCDKWILFKKLSNGWKRFFNWGPLNWINKQIEHILLGKRLGKKSFGIAAIKDAQKHSKNYQMAQVGHLALRNYPKSSISEKQLSKTLKLEIPINSLKQKLAQSKKYKLTYKYPLQKPESPLIRLSDVKLTDETTNHRETRILLEELYSKYDEILLLAIDLVIDGGQPDLNADNKVPRKVVERWWREGKKKRSADKENSKNKKVRKGKKDSKEKQENREQEEQPTQEQIICLEGLHPISELANELKVLALRQGGYLLILLDKLGDVTILKKRLLQATFRYTPFIPIFEPYEYKLNRKPLVVVPVPMLLPRESSHWPNHLRIESDPQSSIEEVDEIIERDNANQLAKTLSALANTAGGRIFLRDQRNGNKDFLEKTLKEATKHWQPHLDIRDVDPEPRKNGWIIRVKPTSSVIYSVDGVVYSWENGKPKELTIDETYKLIKDHCTSHYPLIGTRPVISYANLKWHDFNARESHGVRYDPQKQVIKWSEKIWFWPTPNHKFKMTLPVIINRPVELYREKNIGGQVQVELKEQLKSGLEIDYFNALGEQRPRPQGGLPVIEKKSKIQLEFDIILGAVFQRRLFKTSRKLEFEGVKPDGERLKDIQEMLADLGFENITVKPANPQLDDWAIYLTDDFVKYVMDNGGYIITGFKPKMWVRLYIEGQLMNIRRERKESHRIDRMRLQTGKMRITIYGGKTGKPFQELSVLLNHLQRLLEERFSYIRYQIT